MGENKRNLFTIDGKFYYGWIMLICGFLSMFLSGCAQCPVQAQFLPTNELLQDCNLPSRDGMKTVGDMVRIIKADEYAIKLHNVNMHALRTYVETLRGNGNAR